MWLNQMFADEPIGIRRRCKKRIIIAAVMILFGIGTWAASLMYTLHWTGDRSMFAGDFYSALGPTLIAVGIMQIIRNRRILGSEKMQKKQNLRENDERNRLIGLRCWSYTGYTMFLALYIGVLVSGFFNEIVMRTLLVVMGVYGAVLLGFCLYLKKTM